MPSTAACSVCPARLRLAYPPFYRTFRFWYFTTILRCRYRPNVTSACAGAGAALQPSRATCQRDRKSVVQGKSVGVGDRREVNREGGGYGSGGDWVLSMSMDRR